MRALDFLHLSGLLCSRAGEMLGDTVHKGKCSKSRSFRTSDAPVSTVRTHLTTLDILSDEPTMPWAPVEPARAWSGKCPAGDLRAGASVEEKVDARDRSLALRAAYRTVESSCGQLGHVRPRSRGLPAARRAVGGGRGLGRS